MINYPMPETRAQRRWKPSVLFWIVAALVLLVMIPLVAAGGAGMILFVLGLVAILTGLYVLLFKRRSWVGLPHRKSGGIVAAAGVIALITGAGVVGATASPGGSTDKAALVGPVQQSATAKATPTPTPTPSASNPANTSCTTAAATRKVNDKTFICTVGSDQKLVWMTEADSKRVVAEKAAAETAAAAEKAAAEKAAAEAAAAAKAAADKAAADQAAAQAAQQAAKAVPAPAPAPAPAPVVPAPAPVVPAPVAPPAAAYYANCAAVKAAGAAPIYAGQPGYSTSLDRDRDGVACEN